MLFLSSSSVQLIIENVVSKSEQPGCYLPTYLPQRKVQIRLHYQNSLFDN